MLTGENYFSEINVLHFQGKPSDSFHDALNSIDAPVMKQKAKVMNESNVFLDFQLMTTQLKKYETLFPFPSPFQCVKWSSLHIQKVILYIYLYRLNLE